MARTDIDLDSMSYEELEALIKDAEKARSTLAARRRLEARRAAEEAVKQYGLSIEDVLSAGKSSGSKATKNPPRYVHPEDPKKTWTGKGRKPKWISEALTKGKKLEDFAI